MPRILMTGASGAIGSAAARRMAAAGYSLYLHYNRQREAARRLEAELSAAFPKQDFTSVQADLSCQHGSETLLEQLHFAVDGLVYNCGISEFGLIQDVSDASLERNIRLSLASPYRLIRRLIDPMIQNRAGRIVFISSIWGVTGAANETLYSMVKGGQNSLVKALAKEVAASGVTVNAIAPGAIDTPMLDHFNVAERRALEEEIPAARLGRPEEVAAALVFLLSTDAAYVNGQVIAVNGAWYC
ncbi:MAG: SDR family oxidoreductase [Sporolactobacillus sp.]